MGQELLLYYLFIDIIWSAPTGGNERLHTKHHSPSLLQQSLNKTRKCERKRADDESQLNTKTKSLPARSLTPSSCEANSVV